MPCYAAMNDKPNHIHEDTPVEDALAALENHKTECIAVVDDDKVLQGAFSYQSLYKNLLPVSIPVAGMGTVSMKINAPGVAKRLHKVAALPVRDFMNRKPIVVYPATPTWQGTNMIAQTGDTVFVIDPDTNKLVGTIDGLAIIQELRRLLG